MGILGKLLGTVSGNNMLKVSEQLLFDKVIGFRGIVPGCGVSTMVQNVAIALSERTRYSICVLDTNFLYPVQYALMARGEYSKSAKDILEFDGELSEVTVETQYRNVYLAHLQERTVVDMLSGKDTEYVVEKLIGSLKTYFDVVLVDLGHEMTNIAIHSAVKCNKIYQVADSSLSSMYHMKKSLNTMVTLAVPLAKANRVILNKQLPGVLLGTKSAVQDAGLVVVGEIPLSQEIAVLGAVGKRLYGAPTKNPEVTAFNAVVNDIVAEISSKTVVTEKYRVTMEEREDSEEIADVEGDIGGVIEDSEFEEDLEEQQYDLEDEMQKGVSGE